ncbi:MAG TPA: hypothetical protein VGE15_00035 [Sphingobacteriaceae bacterium]
MQLLRNRIFWTIDLFNHSETRNHINDIKAILENYTSDYSRTRREQLLNQLLTNATQNTPFYQPYAGSLRLEDFPVINKGIIRQDYGRFHATGINADRLIKVLTSGSTGTPFEAFQNTSKKRRNTADTIYFASKANFTVGEQLIYLRRWSEDVRRSKLLACMQNLYMVNVTELTEDFIKDWLKWLRQNPEPKCLIGYVSAFTQICKYLDKIQSPPVDCGVTSIIAVAEGLSDYCRHSMEKYFGVPVVSRYSNMENGILAQECPGQRHFNINWASYVIEILHEDRDEQVPYGTRGRIVLTDLFNYVMPMIRYDTGDLGIMDLDENGTPVLKSVLGRSADMIYNTRGEMINPTIVLELKYYPEIRQFQLIQNGQRSYTLRLTVDGPFGMKDELIARFRQYFGEDAVITIEETDEIPVLASGKRKLVMNNYRQAS